MHIHSFRITRFQFRRDRIIGDSQVGTREVNAAALELVSNTGETGLGFVQTLFSPLPDQAEIERIFATEVWPELEGQDPASLVHRVSRPRGGNQRTTSLPFNEALQVALWDLAAKGAELPLWKLLGAGRNKVRAYASGLDFHLEDEVFCKLFAHADAMGYQAFKIKVGHADFARDMHRLELLRKTVRSGAQFMIDANEAWSAKEAAVNITAIQKAGFDLLWVEDPILRDDYDGLRMLRRSIPETLINSGEYLDASGKRRLMEENATDILNVHGQITDVMRIGWLAAEKGVPVTVGNTFLEVGVHLAVALPEVEWMEYSFQNFDHLVEEPVLIQDGYAYAPDRPGHGLALSDDARAMAQPKLVNFDDLGSAPFNPRLPGDMQSSAAA